MLVNRVSINYNRTKNMSPSRRKGSHTSKRSLIFSGGGGNVQVFSAFVVVLACFFHVINTEEKQERDLQPSAQRRQGYPMEDRHPQSYYSSTFKPSPLLETYYESPDEFGVQESGSMQDRYLDLFIWSKPMPTTNIVNTFMENENELPFLRELSSICPKKDFFFGLNPRHMDAVMKLTDVIMEQRSPDEAIKMAAGLRDRSEINPHAWLRAVVGSTIHRRDLQGLRKPPMVEVMPSMFITTEVLNRVQRSIDSPSRSRKCVLVDGSVGRDNGIENLMWYWREDIMVNSHHWYWHLSYPISGERGRQDREGELFYFMHHSMLARFQAERLSVGLAAVRPYNLQPGTRIPVGYNPHMHDGNSGNNWSARPPGVPVSDVMSNRLPGAPYFVSVQNRSIHLNRILEGISMGSLIDSFGRPVYLDNDEGINHLGNTVEANAYSVNPEYYGYHGIHNNGHNIISLALDPRNEIGLPPGVMGEASTAMRDIVFYNYHEYVDNIFNRYKLTLSPYHLTEGDWPLLVHGVNIHSVKVQSNNLPTNVLHTFWNSRRYDLSRGLDFNRSFVRGPLWTCHQHLDHQDFEYELNIERKDYADNAKTVTVRLFLGPRYDLKGRRYNLEEERHFMFIMDTFTVPLKVGMNVIRRKSVETPLTIDFPESLRELQSQTSPTMPFCGCGWPHHLLIPKGNREGLSMDLFAMVTKSEEDYVEPEGRTSQNCRPAYIFCGIMDERYPDARPMGYPFDRKLFVSDKGPGPAFLEHLVREVPNAAFAHIKILHFDELRNSDDDGYLGPNSFEMDHPDDESQQYLDGREVTTLPVGVSQVTYVDGPDSLSSPHPRLVTSPVSIESPELDDRPEPIPGPPPGPIPGPPPPPPPRTILNLRFRPGRPGIDSAEVFHESAPNFHSTSTTTDSNGIDEYISDDPLGVHAEIRNSIDKINPPQYHNNPPPPPPPHFAPIPHPHAQVRFPQSEALPPVKRPYRSAFRSSFRSLLKTFSPIGTTNIGRTPKSVLALLG